MTEAKIVDQMADWRWRLSNLYWIVNEKGALIPFRPYPAQLDFISKLTGWDLIVKARQLGFSTVVDILGLDCTYSEDLVSNIEMVGSSKILALGLLDGRNTRMDDHETVFRVLDRVLPRVNADFCYLTPTCGLEFLPRDRSLACLLETDDRPSPWRGSGAPAWHGPAGHPRRSGALRWSPASAGRDERKGAGTDGVRHPGGRDAGRQGGDLPRRGE